MPELSFQNIDLIRNEIRKMEITFSHLAEDLIDHVCCDVEYEMQSGLDFSSAYKKVKQKMGPRRLIEIQQETLFAVDTKYRKMKNMMKISGVAGTVLLGFAALFKIQHWPFAGIMVSLGSVILALVFLPSALGVLWKETKSRKRIFLFISAFLSGMFFILGILFKVQHWPGAAILISLAYVAGLFMFIPALLVDRLKNPEKKAKRPVYILGAIGIVFQMFGLLCRIQHWPLAVFFMTGGMSVLFLIVFPWYTWLTWKDEESVKAEFIYLVVASLAIIIPSLLINLNIERSGNQDLGKNHTEKTFYIEGKSSVNNSRHSAELNVTTRQTAYYIERINNEYSVLIAEDPENTLKLKQ